MEVVGPVVAYCTYKCAHRRRRSVSDDVATEVLARDRKRCRYCGVDSKRSAFGLHLHHVIYRSEAGCTHTAGNLITLCNACHNEVHSDKDRYQRILLAMIPLLEDGQDIFVLAMEDLLD